MGTADNAMGGSYGAREFGPSEWANARWRRRGGSRWTAFEIIAMIFSGSSSFGRSVLRFLATSSGRAGTAGLICRRWRPTSGRMRAP